MYLSVSLGRCSEEYIHYFMLFMDSCSKTAVASNPGSPFQILSRSFGDKIRNGEPGFEAPSAAPFWCSLVPRPHLRERVR